MKLDSVFLEKVFKAIIAVLGIFLGYNQYQEHSEHEKLRNAVYDLAIAFDNAQYVPEDMPENSEEYMVNL